MMSPISHISTLACSSPSPLLHRQLSPRAEPERSEPITCQTVAEPLTPQPARIDRLCTEPGKDGNQDAASTIAKLRRDGTSCAGQGMPICKLPSARAVCCDPFKR